MRVGKGTAKDRLRGKGEGGREEDNFELRKGPWTLPLLRRRVLGSLDDRVDAVWFLDHFKTRDIGYYSTAFPPVGPPPCFRRPEGDVAALVRVVVQSNFRKRAHRQRSHPSAEKIGDNNDPFVCYAVPGFVASP